MKLTLGATNPWGLFNRIVDYPSHIPEVIMTYLVDQGRYIDLYQIRKVRDG